MHPNPRRIIPAALLLVALAVLGYWYFWIRPASAAESSLSASGTIEAVQVQISPELGGKAVSVRVSEGDSVKAGDVLLELDTSLLKAQRTQAAAALEIARANAAAAQANTAAAQAAQTGAEAAQSAAQFAQQAAQANLDLLAAGATNEQLRAAEEQAHLAQSNYQAALAGYAALTAGARPEEVSAARLRLDTARSTYTALTVTLDNNQVEDLRAAASQAEQNLTNVQSRQDELKGDTRTPPAILEALPGMVADARLVQDMAQEALTDAENSALPFYQQVEAAHRSQYLADLMLSQAKARQAALQGVSDVTQAAKDALQAGVDDAQDMATAAKTAYDALNTSAQATQLKTAWDDAQQALADLNRLARGGTTPLETVLNQVDAAAAGESAAQATYLNLKNGARAEQVAMAQAQVDAAQANIQASQAQVDAAQARVEAAQAQAGAAQAQVDAAQAALDILDVQIGKMTITAPSDGVVMTRAIEPGEFAAPGGALLTLGRLEQTITVYIPEDRYGEISVGQTAIVSADSFPGEKFQASVIYISEKAEFTPRNVQTVEGRKSTVFAIKLKLDDSSGKLKPGMPADVVFK